MREKNEIIPDVAEFIIGRIRATRRLMRATLASKTNPKVPLVPHRHTTVVKSDARCAM